MQVFGTSVFRLEYCRVSGISECTYFIETEMAYGVIRI